MRTRLHIAFRPWRQALAVALFATLNSQLAAAFAENTVVTYQGRVTANGTNAPADRDNERQSFKLESEREL